MANTITNNEMVKALKLSAMKLQLQFAEIARANGNEHLIPSREVAISRIAAFDTKPLSEIEELYLSL